MISITDLLRFYRYPNSKLLEQPGHVRFSNLAHRLVWLLGLPRPTYLGPSLGQKRTSSCLLHTKQQRHCICILSRPAISMRQNVRQQLLIGASTLQMHARHDAFSIQARRETAPVRGTSPHASRVSDLTTTAAGQTIVKLHSPQKGLPGSCRS